MFIPLREDFMPYLKHRGREEFVQMGLREIDNSGGAFLGYPLSDSVKKSFQRENKSFIGARRTQLAALDEAQESALYDVLKARRSTRRYSGEPMPLATLSMLLQRSMGMLHGGTEKYQGEMRRVYPSGGALYTVDAYLLVKNVEGLDQGTYSFRPNTRELVHLRNENFTMQSYLFDQPEFDELLTTTNVAVILCGYFEKSYFKYGERALKLALLEAGHIAQNFYLNCADLGNIGICGHGGFHGNLLEKFLDLDPRSEQILYPLTLGMI